jgi:predicted nucleic acid-binding protein
MPLGHEPHTDSALFDQRKDSLCQVQHTQSREWLDQEALYYNLYGSSVVVDELQAGVYDHQAEALTFAKELSQLPLTDEVFGVARIYAEQLLMPKSSPGDALHLAAASIGEIDYLLTWNCRHLANPNKVRRIAEVNRRLGLMVPQLVTPAMLYKEG